jgi:hypothetical protein
VIATRIAQFNILKLCILPTECICLFHMVLTMNSYLFAQTALTGWSLRRRSNVFSVRYERTRNEENKCWRGPAAIYTTWPYPTWHSLQSVKYRVSDKRLKNTQILNSSSQISAMSASLSSEIWITSKEYFSLAHTQNQALTSHVRIQMLLWWSMVMAINANSQL